MMNRLTMEPGRVVQSTQGRDAGRYFVGFRSWTIGMC